MNLIKILLATIGGFCACAVADVAQPEYNVSTLLTSAQGAFRHLAQDPGNKDRLLSVGLDSAIYEINLAAPPEQQVVLWAGTPGHAHHQDGARLGQASFHKPSALCVLPGGDVVVADTGSATIRHISAATGRVSTPAGQPYHAGIKDGPGGVAKFGTPTGLACLSGGRLLVGDPGTQSLRMVSCTSSSSSSSSTVSARAGAGHVRAEATDRLPDCLVTTLHRLHNTTTHGAFMHLALDPSQRDRLLISDGHTALWEVPELRTSATLLRLFAGHAGGVPSHADGQRLGGAAFDGPAQLCVMEDGHVVVAEAGSSTVRHIHATTGDVTTIAGQPYQEGSQDGQGSQALLSQPSSLVCSLGGPAGQLLLSELASPHARLRRLDCMSGCSTGAHSGDEAQRHAAVLLPVLLVGCSALLVALLAWGMPLARRLAQLPAGLQELRHQHQGPPYGYERLEAGMGPEHEHESAASADLLQLEEVDLLGQEVIPIHHPAASHAAEELHGSAEEPHSAGAGRQGATSTSGTGQDGEPAQGLI